MRVGSVSSVYSKPQIYKRVKAKNDGGGDSAQPAVNFQGKFGQIVGGTAGAGFIIGASLIASPAVAPFLICLTGGGLLSGAIGGHILEDKMNKEGEFREDDKK